MSAPFTESSGLPVNAAIPVITYSPLVLRVPGRVVPLELKVSLPAVGTELPILLLSHGHGRSNFLASYHGYGPVASFWAAHGFAVIQPTHLDANEYALRDAHAEGPLFVASRANDLTYILDHLAEIEAGVPGLAARKLDRDRIGAVGHSLGGSTVAQLLGMRIGAASEPDPRIKAGVVIGAAGVADEHSGKILEMYPALAAIDYSAMTSPTLVIAGDQDVNAMFSTRASYRSDAYTHSPGGNKTLLMFAGAGHLFGGISGYDANETSDENPERVAALRALVWAYLRSQLYAGDDAWSKATAALASTMATVSTR